MTVLMYYISYSQSRLLNNHNNNNNNNINNNNNNNTRNGQPFGNSASVPALVCSSTAL